MIRLYIDEDSMDRDLVYALRARGVDVTTAYDEGMSDRDDQEHLDYATGQERVLYSFNRGDFYELHTLYLTQGKAHAGIILARQQAYSVGELMRRLLKLTAAKSAEDMRNEVEFLSAWG
ncbi:MAG: DUF5615 family PIN-like protein [Chloroflexi bacterium]|nr:DUF5615 family PIN-like protein [Chloroflexota bacterium]